MEVFSALQIGMNTLMTRRSSVTETELREKQEAQLSQRGRACFARSLEVTQGHSK